MKKRLFAFLSAALIIAVGIAAFSISYSKAGSVKAAGNGENPQTEARNARFLNMLNHNFVYNEDFNDINSIVNNSVIAILDNRDKADEDYISAELVKSFVRSMYGVEIADISQINEDFPKKDGFVYIIGRGYSKYEHEILNVSVNEDGTFTVKTSVKVSSHDSGKETLTASTIFVKNENSEFGYNIVSSEIFFAEKVV